MDFANLGDPGGVEAAEGGSGISAGSREVDALKEAEMDFSGCRRGETGGLSTARVLGMSDSEAPMCVRESDISSTNDESLALLKGGVVTEYPGTAVAGSGTGCA